MNTTMQEKDGPVFHVHLKKAQVSPNTIRSCMAACRLYYSLCDDLAVSRLICFRDYLINHYEAVVVNNRIYGINQYLGCLEEFCGGQMPHLRLTVIHTQQVASLDNVISQKDYETFKKTLKNGGNLLRYFVV